MKNNLFYIFILIIVSMISCNTNDQESKIHPRATPENNEIQYFFEDLVDLSLKELKIKRNEIYARKGKKFKSKELQKYFGQFDWYKPQYENVVNMLNKQDHENIAKVKKAENLLKVPVIFKKKID